MLKTKTGLQEIDIPVKADKRSPPLFLHVFKFNLLHELLATRHGRRLEK